jgi:hypothetical protein
VLDGLYVLREWLAKSEATKAFFTRKVAPALANHSLKVRLEWALQQAARQWPLERADDDEDEDFYSPTNTNDEF